MFPLHWRSVDLLPCDRLSLSLIINSIQEQAADDNTNEENIAEKELDETFKGMRQARDCGANSGEERGEDTEDKADEVLKQRDHPREGGGDGVEDGGDEGEERVDERRHVLRFCRFVCVCVCL